MTQGIQEIELPGGTVVLARITMPDGYGGYEDVGVMDAVAARVERLKELITGVGAAVMAAAAAAKPDEASVSFGIELAAKSGKAVAAVLADGEAKASINVTLTWQLAAAEASPSSEAGTGP